MSASLRPDALKRVLRAAKDSIDQAPMGPEDDPLRQMIYSFLLWEAPASRVEAAMARMDEAWLDVNEMRVSLPDEFVSAMGERYPRVAERARLLRESLNEIYLREHAVSLDSLKQAPKREARKYLESIPSMPHFVSSRVTLLALGGHAFPLDQQMLDRLIAEQILDDDTDLERAASLLERGVKAAEARDVYLLLEAWSDPARKSRGKRSASKGGARGNARSSKTAQA